MTKLYRFKVFGFSGQKWVCDLEKWVKVAESGSVYLRLLVKSSQVYFFNSRIKYTAKLHNTKLYTVKYTHNKIIQ